MSAQHLRWAAPRRRRPRRFLRLSPDAPVRSNSWGFRRQAAMRSALVGPTRTRWARCGDATLVPRLLLSAPQRSMFPGKKRESRLLAIGLRDLQRLPPPLPWSAVVMKPSDHASSSVVTYEGAISNQLERWVWSCLLMSLRRPRLF